jgi:hypothetical protein
MADIPAPLIQIRRGYATAYCDLRLSVETDAGGWKAQVRDGHRGPTLYSAQRCSLSAAKVAAAEFAVFSTAGVTSSTSPEATAKFLRWNEYW